MTEQEQKSAGKLARDLELIVQTGLSLGRESNLQSLVQAATDAGLQLCGAQFGAFFYNVMDADGESYKLHILSGVDREKFSRFPMPRNTALFAQTFNGVGVVRSGDVTKDPRYGKNAPHAGMPEGHLPVRSYLAVPVTGQTGKVLGALLYGHENPDVFQQSDEDRVATIASQAAVAIENFQLREELTQKVDALQRAQQKLLENSKHLGTLAAIVESSEDAILSKDLNGRITSWNQAAANLFGYSEEEMVGQSILSLIPEELHPEETTIIGRVRAGERIEHFETIRVKKDGERFDVSLTISPVRDQSGLVVGASKILRDISSRKRIEASLIKSEKIAATGRMAATIAHEVNNPLEAVTNLIYLAILSIDNPDEARAFLRTAEGEVARVSHIAKQTLGFYRENASPVSSSLSDLAAEAIKVYQSKCFEFGIKLINRLDSDRMVVIKKGELMQVISNLIANSIYAMPSGGTLTVSTKDIEKDGRPGVLVTVEDTGVGIPAEQISKIFDAFFTTRSAIGTGIGLFVAKQFIESHHGNIEVASSTNPDSHGTCMSIFLPV